MAERDGGPEAGGESPVPGAAAAAGGEALVAPATATAARARDGPHTAAAGKVSWSEDLRSGFSLALRLCLHGMQGVLSVFVMRACYFGWGYQTGLFGGSWAVLVDAVRGLRQARASRRLWSR
jgi:hypothetical protein